MGRGRAVTTIAVMAFVFIGTATGWTRQAGLERRATQLTGLTPSIVCETAFEHAEGVKAGTTEYLGFTRGTRLVVLSPDTCRSLAASNMATPRFALGTWVLAHELGHVVNGTTDETAAECYALANWRELAGLLGLTRPTPAQEARVAAAHDRLPPSYRGRC